VADRVEGAGVLRHRLLRLQHQAARLVADLQRDGHVFLDGRGTAGAGCGSPDDEQGDGDQGTGCNS
jgi:hypothetical protein